MLSLLLPAALTHIGINAFSNNERLTGTLSIPSNVTYIGFGAFGGCNWLHIDLYPTNIEAQKTEEEISPKINNPWFWNNKVTYSGTIIHVQNSIDSLEKARNLYGYYWNFTSEETWLGWSNDLGAY